MRHTAHTNDTTMNTNDSSPVLFEYTSLDIVDVEAVWAFLYEDGEASVTVNEQDEETRGESEYERELERTFEDIIENQPILGSSFDNFLLDGLI
ncbi:unnamed protein product [Cuscuta epithymum]|uniref:Uncharacterized protein n=1 Tax=Cuscuta epithymum TaxID=186058 RepID=A0AAV0DIN2_9ASTE|nr:unnamed protein product [Cuscuta epithymum]